MDWMIGFIVGMNVGSLTNMRIPSSTEVLGILMNKDNRYMFLSALALFGAMIVFSIMQGLIEGGPRISFLAKRVTLFVIVSTIIICYSGFAHLVSSVFPT